MTAMNICAHPGEEGANLGTVDGLVCREHVLTKEVRHDNSEAGGGKVIDVLARAGG
jgi:hypothetical protein